MIKLNLQILNEAYALTRLAPDAPPPNWAQGRLTSITRTPLELTVICEQAYVPPGLDTQAGFRCLEVVAEFALDAVGVVAAVSAPIAKAGVSLFLVSVWSTDFILVANADLDRSVAALSDAGHSACWAK
jgi:hypothetical protein